MEDDELLIEKPEVFLFKIPKSIQKKKGYLHRASDWNITEPDWYGKIAIFKADPSCHVQLEDRKGDIYGQAVIEEFPGGTLVPVLDSSRYFTLNLQDIHGKFELVGIGFSDRTDSAELSRVLTQYFVQIRNSSKRKRDVEKAKTLLKETVRVEKPNTNDNGQTQNNSGKASVNLEASGPTPAKQAKLIVSEQIAKDEGDKSSILVPVVPVVQPEKPVVQTTKPVAKVQGQVHPPTTPLVSKESIVKEPEKSEKPVGPEVLPTPEPKQSPPVVTPSLATTISKLAAAIKKPVPRAGGGNEPTKSQEQEPKPLSREPVVQDSAGKNVTPKGTISAAAAKAAALKSILKKSTISAGCSLVPIVPAAPPVAGPPEAVKERLVKAKPLVPYGSPFPLVPYSEESTVAVEKTKAPKPPRASTLPRSALFQEKKSEEPTSVEEAKVREESVKSPKAVEANESSKDPEVPEKVPEIKAVEDVAKTKAPEDTPENKNDEAMEVTEDSKDVPEVKSTEEAAPEVPSKTKPTPEVAPEVLSPPEDVLAEEIPSEEASMEATPSTAGLEAPTEGSEEAEPTEDPLADSNPAPEDPSEENYSEQDPLADAEHPPEDVPKETLEDKDPLADAEPAAEDISECLGVEDPEEDSEELTKETSEVDATDALDEEDQEPEDQVSPATLYALTNDPSYKYTSSSKNTFLCHKCNEEFSDAKALKSHWVAQHQLKKACYCQCGLPFPLLLEMQKHKKKHHPRTYFCILCNRRFNTDADVDKHLLGQHGVSEPKGKKFHSLHFKFPCELCSVTLNTKQKFLKHWNKTHRECTDATDAGDAELDNNGAEMEATEGNESELNTTGSTDAGEAEEVDTDAKFRIGPVTIAVGYKYKNGKEFQCHKCEEKFEDVRKIKSHWKLVHKLRSPTHCSICKLPFPNVGEMVQHKKDSHGFTCAECGKQFKKEVGLKDHTKNAHGKRADQSCTVCGASFKLRFQLVRHIEAQHEEVSGEAILYRCEHCHEKFLSPEDLAGHVLTHQLNFACDHCEDRRFKSKSAVRNHYKQCHPGVDMPSMEELGVESS